MAFDRDSKCKVCFNWHLNTQGKGSSNNFICDHCFADLLEKMVFEWVREKKKDA